jgi:hypothetical protein
MYPPGNYTNAAGNRNLLAVNNTYPTRQNMLLTYLSVNKK